jgi:hypothetical protein
MTPSLKTLLLISLSTTLCLASKAQLEFGRMTTKNFTGTGFYLEPNVGYTFGGSDIIKADAYGNQITDANGNPIDQKVSGPSTGLSVGYIFPGFPVNLGLRYERVFSNPDPGVNLFTFRATYFLSFGHRDD